MMRILIHSNAPWVGSGYGMQTALWAPLLASLGHDVAISAFYGLSGSALKWGDHAVYPAGQAPYGWDVIAGHANDWGADLVLTIMDTYVMEPEIIAAMRRAGTKVAQWTPVDCTPLGIVDRTCLQVSGATPIAMSRHGHRELQAAGLDPLYVPHGIDCRVFRPPADRVADRAAMGISPDTFVIGIAAANKDAIRKSFPEQFRAFAAFHEKHPDSLLMVHSLAECKGGIDLQALAIACGIGGAIAFTDQYAQVAGQVGREDMARWYGAIDVLSACAAGEGFGLPILEAQACGTPVIVTDASAMAELVGAGWKVKGEPLWNPVHRAWWTRPSIKQIGLAYEKAFSGRAGRGARAAVAREFALGYDAMSILASHWAPVLQALEADDAIAEYDGLKWRIGSRARTGDVLALGHERLLDPIVLGLLPEDGVFLDVGAHVGHYALRAAARASKVIAIEANPQTSARLLENVKLNDLQNVEIYVMAAWDSEQPLRLSFPSGHDRDGSARTRPGDDGPETFGCPLDVTLAREPRIDLVKLDVEGADLHALRGMRGLLARCRPVLFIEDHSMYEGTYERADLDALLAELGYEWEDLPLYKGYLIARPAG